MVTRRTKRKADTRGPLQRLHDRAEVERQQSELSVITEAQRAKGTYQGERKIRNSNLLERWFDEGGPGFEDGARLAIEWCHKRWEARGVIGRQAANYGDFAGGGLLCGPDRDVELRDDLDEVRQWFHPAHWAIFEGVVRWGEPAGVAGSTLANTPSQSIAAAKAVVGMIASFIASKKGY